jgi:hypothetical protein
MDTLNEDLTPRTAVSALVSRVTPNRFNGQKYKVYFHQNLKRHEIHILYQVQFFNKFSGFQNN